MANLEELDGYEDEVEDVAPEGADPSIVSDEPNRQPTDDTRTKAKKPNLDDDPNFRKWKSEQDKRQAALEKQLQSEARAREELQQRTAWYEQQLEAMQTQGMSDPDRLAYENQKLKRQLGAVSQQQAIEQGKQRVFARISAVTGVPTEVYADAQDADEAWEKATNYLKTTTSTQAQQQAEARQRKREANEVDLGGGSSTPPDSEYEAEAKRLRKRKDAVGLFKQALTNRR